MISYTRSIFKQGLSASPLSLSDSHTFLQNLQGHTFGHVSLFEYHITDNFVEDNLFLFVSLTTFKALESSLSFNIFSKTLDTIFWWKGCVLQLRHQKVILSWTRTSILPNATLYFNLMTLNQFVVKFLLQVCRNSQVLTKVG